MIEQTLVAVLKNDSAVSALVGTRIRPLNLKQEDALPGVVYQRVSTVPVTSLDGDSGVDAVRIQVSCWAETYSGARALAAAVRAAVTGGMVAVTEMDIDDRDEATQHYRVILDFRIWQK